MTAIFPPSAYRVAIAFADGPLVASPTWTDVTAWWMTLSTQRGRSSELDDFQAGTAAVTLDNRDRRFDPSHGSSPYAPGVTIRRQLRIQAVVGATTYPVFRGVITAWRQQWAHDDGQTATVEAVDLAAFLASCDLPSPAVGAVAVSLAASAWWPLDGDVLVDNLDRWPGLYDSRDPGDPLGVAEESSKVASPASPALSRSVGYATWRPGASTKTTIGLLVRVNTASTSNIIVDAPGTLGAGWHLRIYIDSSGQLAAQCSVAPSTPITATATEPAAWTPGAHHVAVVRDGATVTVYRDGAQVATATNGSMTAALTPAGVRFASASAASTVDIDVAHCVAWQGVALTADQVRAWAAASLTDRLDVTVSGRLTAIADLCGVPSALRSIGASGQAVGAFGGGDAWSAAQRCARSELGRLFVDRAGVLTFEPRTVDMGAAATAAFADDSTPSAIRFAGYTLEQSDRWVYNTVTVEGADGAESTVIDSASVASYGPLGLSVSTDLPDASSCASIAGVLAGRYASPSTRGSQWLCDPVDDSQLAAVLGVELGDIVTVKRTPKVGSAVTATVQIVSIGHSVDSGGSAQVTFAAAPVDTASAARWGTDVWDTGKWG